MAGKGFMFVELLVAIPVIALLMYRAGYEPMPAKSPYRSWRVFAGGSDHSSRFAVERREQTAIVPKGAGHLRLCRRTRLSNLDSLRFRRNL